MIRFCNLYIPSQLILFVAIDGIFLTFVLLAALNAGPVHLFMLPTWRTFVMAATGGAVSIWCLYFFDLSDLDLARGTPELLLRGLRALGCGILLVAPAWWLLTPQENVYRTLEPSLVLFIVVLCTYRFVADWVGRRALGGERVLLVGTGPSIPLLAEAMKQRGCLPLKMSGVVVEDVNTHAGMLAFATCGHLGEFEAVTRSFRPDRIAIGLHPTAVPLSSKKLYELRRSGIRVEDATELYEALTGRVPVELVAVERMAYGRGFGQSKLSLVVYRAIGSLAAMLGMIVLTPLFLLIGIAIKLNSRGPILYKQERVGAFGKTFNTLKFRSMRIDAEKLSGPVWATDNDPRVTAVGRFLRKVRMDELPQLWNVVRGEMHFVGPRPERPHFVEMLSEHIAYYDLRHSIPPGITGWAQVCASYGSNIEESRVKLEYDLFYLKNRSPLFDLLILFKTVKIAVFGRGAR
jgi:exopolysaccharide biosynthesis polyprenyl glycosylphosphotransferase